MMFDVGDRVSVRRPGKDRAATGTITHRTWENGSYVRLDDGREVIARHEHLTHIPLGGG